MIRFSLVLYLDVPLTDFLTILPYQKFFKPFLSRTETRSPYFFEAENSLDFSIIFPTSPNLGGRHPLVTRNIFLGYSDDDPIQSRSLSRYPSLVRHPSERLYIDVPNLTDFLTILPYQKFFQPFLAELSRALTSSKPKTH